MVTCSIVIPNYNGEPFLEKCLRSLYKQQGIEFEVILIDNASTDHSLDFVREAYPEVRVIQLERNYGFSRAVNEGILRACGQFVVLLNNDTEVEEDWLASLYRHINSNELIFSVSSKMIRMNQRNMIDDAGDELTVFGWAFKRGDGEPASDYREGGSVFSSCAGAAIYRKAVFDEIGLFDEQFFAYLEDVDIGYRARLFGYKNEYCPDAVVYHVGSGTSGSKYNEFKIKLSARNNVYLLYKNMPFIQMLINLPFLVVGYLVKYVFFLRAGWSKVYLSGFYEGITHLNLVQRQKFRYKAWPHYWNIQRMLVSSTVRYIKNRMIR
ncbi:glycosyltransferase family 2 protein [Paenibacillus kobensis]|uniref:glycosyltransferase family 2 protein n=1 Tax=Paenibacillus kobensis TaxID=59841 RepID=UPI000FD71DF9|nr:glycosyltransferase family 2 protein [Paenibacillus kobensis]